MKRILVLTSLAILSSNCLAGSELKTTLLVTDKGRELFKSWESPDGERFDILPLKVAKRGEFLSAVVLFQGCMVDAEGNCNVTLEITAYDPSGKKYGEFLGQELWVGKPAPTDGGTQLGVGYMGLVIEPHDPSGKYRVFASANDIIANVSVLSEVTFEIK